VAAKALLSQPFLASRNWKNIEKQYIRDANVLEEEG
jgi:hypothetical protein